MDKLAKVRAEIKRLYNQSLADEKRQADLGLERAADISYGKSKACKELLSFYDSMQEEPESHKPKITLGEATGKLKELLDNMKDSAAKDLGLSEEDYNKAIDECLYGKEPELVDDGDLPKEEPVSEELGEAASRYAKEEYSRKNPATLPDRCIGCYAPIMYAFRNGANWKEQQLMANAVDGTLYSTICGSEQNVVAYVGYGEYGKDGDKVKVIVIKED